MFMYAIGTLPLIRSLSNPARWTQLWYADDASAGGSISELHEWFSLVCSSGPAFGYFPEPRKSILVVNEHFRTEAETMFSDLGVRVVTGNRFLGGFIGDLSDQNSYVTSKIQKWVGNIKVLSDVAVTQPQLAYAAFTKSLQHEWAFLMRVVPGCEPLFLELEHTILHQFLPTIFGVEISTAECDLFALSLHFGGLRVGNPVSIASCLFDSSVRGTVTIVHSIVGAATFELDAHLETVSQARTHHCKCMDTVYVRIKCTMDSPGFLAHSLLLPHK